MNNQEHRIFVVDDDNMMRELIVERLSLKGYMVESAGSGKEAIRKLEKLSFHLFLIDIKMPGVSGLDILEKLDVKNNPCEVIIITGHGGLDSARVAMELGAFSYITKPFDNKDLMNQVKKALEMVALKKIKFDHTKGLEEEVRSRTEELTNSQRQLRDLAAHLQSIREEERTMVAREIHDELGQVLTALKMDLSWLTNKLPHDQSSLLKKTESMNQLIDSTIETVRRISTELRPGLLDDMGLVAAIEWQTEEFRNRTGINCKMTADIKEEYLDENCKTIIFRILQEALTNIVRHAGATKVKVSVLEKDGELKLKIGDNGKGIKEEHISHRESLGLIGISERARSQGGSVKFQGVSGKGTTVTVSIPLNKETVGSKQ